MGQEVNCVVFLCTTLREIRSIKSRKLPPPNKSTIRGRKLQHSWDKLTFVGLLFFALSNGLISPFRGGKGGKKIQITRLYWETDFSPPECFSQSSTDREKKQQFNTQILQVGGGFYLHNQLLQFQRINGEIIAKVWTPVPKDTMPRRAHAMF